MVKIIGIAGLDKKELFKIKNSNKKVNIFNLNDRNFLSKKNLNAILIYGEWAVKRQLNSFFKDKYNYFSNLEWVHLSRAGVDEFSDFLKNYNFKLTCGKIIQGPNVSEHCLALLLSLTRGLYHFDKKKFRPTEIYNKNILIVGLGGIGTCVAEKLNSFGAVISSVENSIKPCYSFIKKNYEISQLKNIINNFDIVINSTPLTKQTKNLFNKEIFDRMKKGVFFINISRGGIVNTKDLIMYLNKNKFSGVGLDIVSEKNFEKKNPFCKYKNVILTNHMAGITTDNVRRLSLLKNNLSRYLNNEVLLNKVDVESQY